MTDETHYAGYRQWKHWNRLFDPLPYESKLFEREFKGIAIAERQLLDIGFGSGALLGWAKAKGAHIAGIELQSELREAARKQGIRAYADICEIEDASFSVIALFDVLEHIPGGQLTGFLQSIRRIAKSDARILIRVPNCQSAVGLLTQFGDATHVTMLSGPIVEQLCMRVGLRVLCAREGAEHEAPAGLMRRLFRPFQKLLRSAVKLAFRFVWSSGGAPLSANVVIIATVEENQGP